MPPGAPFLLMKQPQVPQPLHNNQFPTDHGRVVLVAGRHMPSAASSSSSSSSSSSPPNSQLVSAQPSVSGHSTQLSSHGGQSVTSSLGIGGISSSSSSNSNNRGGGGSGGEGSRRSANGGKGAAMTSREKKDLFTQRKQREFIPDNKKDDNYWDRRRRNNEAAKRSREKRRFNDMILEQRVIELTKENHILKAQLDAIKDKYNICGENLISLDQILSTMPTPDQVLNVNNAGHLTIASGLTTQHFRNFQLAREARGAAESVITTGSPSPAKKMKVSPKSEERSSSGGDDDEGSVVHRINHSNGSSSNSNELPPQPDSQRREHQQLSSTEKDYYKRTVSPNSPAVRLVGASPLPLPLDKSPPNGLINYSLRDIYYNSNGGPPMAEGANALMANRPPLQPPPTSSSGDPPHNPHHQQHHHFDRGEGRPESEFGPAFPYASSSSSNGNVPVKYEEPDDGHHCGAASPPYRPHPAHVPLKVHPGGHYFYDEQRRKHFEESTLPENGDNDQHEVVDREQQFMLLHRRQPEGAHLSQLELILNLSAKRDTEIDQRSMGEPEIHCTDRDSPVLIAASTKSHPNLLPLKLRHKANVKHGPELRRVLMHGGDEAMDEVDVDSHHSQLQHYPHHLNHMNPHHLEPHNPRFDPYLNPHHHHHHLHLRHSPTEDERQQQQQLHHQQHKTCPEDGRLVKTEDYDDEEEDEELQHQQRIIESGNARRVHCCIEVEKLSNDDEEEKRYRAEVNEARASMSPKPNNNILKSQLARLENEMATIKNLMYMNTNQATAAAQ